MTTPKGENGLCAAQRQWTIDSISYPSFVAAHYNDYYQIVKVQINPISSPTILVRSNRIPLHPTAHRTRIHIKSRVPALEVRNVRGENEFSVSGAVAAVSGWMGNSVRKDIIVLGDARDRPTDGACTCTPRSHRVSRSALRHSIRL